MKHSRDAVEQHQGNRDHSLGGTLEQSGLGVPRESDRNWLPWIAAVVVLAIVGVLITLLTETGRRSPASGPDPYAANVSFSNIHLSQASNFAGDQLTYVEGTVTNRGSRTITGATVEVTFAKDVGEQPQVQKVPLSLVRSRQPYVDTVPVSAAPLKPGTAQEFRLTFDSISPMWNQQTPAISVASVATRP